MHGKMSCVWKLSHFVSLTGTFEVEEKKEKGMYPAPGLSQQWADRLPLEVLREQVTAIPCGTSTVEEVADPSALNNHRLSQCQRGETTLLVTSLHMHVQM